VLQLRDHPSGTTVLAMGIVGVVACPLLAPFAWSMGSGTLREIDRDRWSYGNRGSVAVGRALGIWGTLQLVVVALVVGLFFVLAGSTTTVISDTTTTTTTVVGGP
jgi:hypothetical protein